MSMGEAGDYYRASTVETDEQGMPKTPGAINGGIYKRQTPEQAPMNYVNVEDIEEYVAKAKGLGATVMMEKMPVPGMGYFAMLMDPQRNMFGIWKSDMSAA
jgi:predicted enzyme related to lactoylglutathione lyase